MRHYGKELILDIHNCDSSTFTRKSIRNFFKKLCDLIDMERCKLIFWDDLGVAPEEQETEPHLKGTSAIQFIRTSNITIHTLDLTRTVYVNIFSCKAFDVNITKRLTEQWFKGRTVNECVVERK